MSVNRKCSIITVSYNSGKTISKTIQSVLDQTYDNIEYLIIDGGSTDNTVDIIRQYEPMFEGRLKWISEPDDGIYFAMNKGIDMATGDLIGIINSDDYYEKDAVEVMMDKLADHTGNLILYGMVRTLKDNVEMNVAIFSHNFLRECTLAHPGCFVTKQLYDTYGAFDTQYVSASDYDFLLRMNEKEDVIFQPVYKTVANFATGGMCSSSVAYYDLLKVQRDHGIITKKEYYHTYYKCKLYDLIH